MVIILNIVGLIEVELLQFILYTYCMYSIVNVQYIVYCTCTVLYILNIAGRHPLDGTLSHQYIITNEHKVIQLGAYHEFILLQYILLILGWSCCDVVLIVMVYQCHSMLPPVPPTGFFNVLGMCCRII